MKTTKRILKTLLVATMAIVALLATATLLLNTKSVQNMLLSQATSMLEDKLNTRVKIDSISVSLFGMDANLFGLLVEDQEHRPLVEIERASLDLSLHRLLRREVIIDKALVDGAFVRLFKPKKGEAGTANYQFLIDAFKHSKDSTARADSTAKQRHKLKLDAGDLRLKNISVSYNTATFHLLDAHYNKQESRLTIDSLRWRTDNHLPRKNTGKPHRGFFDVGHLDMTLSMEWAISQLSADSVKATLKRCTATDRLTGINITDLRLGVQASKQAIDVSGVVLRQRDTELRIPRARFLLPSKQSGRQLSYTADTITGRVLLKDISHTFAPVLKGFKMPLHLSLGLSGTASELMFHRVKVSTTDHKLRIAASGGVDSLRGKHKYKVHFHVDRLVAKAGMAERIIDQFVVKRYMMKQLQRLGTLTYTGNFSVVYRHEHFAGRLSTAAGPVNFQLSINEDSKYLSGHVDTPTFEIGQVMDMSHLGSVTCQADFRFDISKKRTAQMRREIGGKLPIGNVSAQVTDCSYLGIHLRDLLVDMSSNGGEAQGKITDLGRYRDVYCNFSFTDTDDMKKLKVKTPHISFHKRHATSKDKQAKRQ